jgi:hypothetical protein
LISSASWCTYDCIHFAWFFHENRSMPFSSVRQNRQVSSASRTKNGRMLSSLRETGRKKTAPPDTGRAVLQAAYFIGF